MSSREQLEAELEVVSLEEELLHVKGLKKPDAGRLREVKDQLRAAREKYRTATAGAGTANPDVIEATAEVNN